jgi:uncharacterized membrane protein
MNNNLRHNYLPIILIICLGLFLRLFQIGSDGFWIDELGVAKAAHASSLTEVLSIVRSHVMAMPLDYLVVWGMGYFSTAEGWLRLPEAIWGALTLIPAYSLYRDQISRRAARLGIFLLAISPMLIKYSQELRFYAPLVFFYTLSTTVGAKAAKKNSTTLWVVFTLVTIIGTFFHLYVALSFINVAFLFIVYASKKNRSLLPIAASFLSVFLSTTVAVAQFGKLAGEHVSLFAFETPVQVIGVGLGFLPPFNAPQTAHFLGLIFLCSTLFGLIRLRKLMPFAIAILVQTIIILGLAEWRGYFASSRQFLPLIPMVTLFAAGGLDLSLEFITRRNWLGTHDRLPEVSICLVLSAASFLVLFPYYKAEKTSTCYIVDALKIDWKSGQQIWIAPSYNLDVYSYYAPLLAADLHLFELALPQKALENAAFIIADPNFNAGLGFIKTYQSPETTFYPMDLWRRP